MDSSNTSTDRDLSIETRSSVHKNNGVIDSPQISYETILQGRDISNEEPTNNIRDNVTTKEACAQQESDDSKVDEVDAYDETARMEEEPTIIPSTKTVVTNESTLILDHQVNQYTFPGVTTKVHSQDHSGSQSISETVPTEAQDSGGQEVLGQATTTIKTTFSNPPVDSSLVTGKPTLSSIQSSGIERTHIVYKRLAIMQLYYTL